MSELEPRSFPEGLNPGDVTRFADMRELMAFEDMLAPIVDPEANLSLWQARPKLSELFRPDKFYGTIRDITLMVMDDPYARMHDANARGWIFSKSSRPSKRTREGSEKAISKCIGFEFDAEAYSTNPDLRGRMSAELWYLPMPRGVVKAGSSFSQIQQLKSGEQKVYAYTTEKDIYRSTANRTGEAIRRVTTKPSYDKKRFEAAHDTSCAIGFTVLAEAMKHPVSTNMRD